MFALDQFVASFDRNVLRVARAEKITKELVKTLSRDVLSAVHATGDCSYLNKLKDVLTPMNKRTFVLFAKTFSGFVYAEDEQLFTKKDKKGYEAKAKAAEEALADPHFNMWTWSEKHVDVDVKPLDLSKVTQFIKGAIKKAADQGIAQSEVIKAVFAAGMDVDALLVVLGEMEEIDVKVNE